MRAASRDKRDALLRKVVSCPVVMGVLNVTPDSFSDGGRYSDVVAAVARAVEMVSEGCDIIDVGGESTRPGVSPVPEADELARIEPVFAALIRAIDAPLSIDTSKAKVAACAAQCGAVLINDVWGLQQDPAMADTVAEAETAVVLMHNRTTKDDSIDILTDMRRFFDRSLELAEKAGIPKTRIILDPGIGFGKTGRQNWEALARLSDLSVYGFPLLVGLSRKAFLGSLGTGAEAGLAGTIAANLAAAAAGASIFRVHDVAAHVAALNVFHTIRRGAAT